MPALRDNLRTIIIGKSGCGKSWLGRYWFTKYYVLPDKRERYIVVDVKPTHHTPAPRPEEFGLKDLGFRLVKVDYSILKRGESEGIRWNEYIRAARRVVFQISGTPEQMRRAASAIAWATLNAGDAVIMVDEGHMFLPNRPSIPDEEQGLILLLTTGREKGVDTIFIAQHEVTFSKMVLHSANRIISFGTRSPNELDKLAQIFDYGREILPDLPKYHFLFLNNDTGEQWVGNGRDLRKPI
jgi:hypothetical protein